MDDADAVEEDVAPTAALLILDDRRAFVAVVSELTLLPLSVSASGPLEDALAGSFPLLPMVAPFFLPGLLL